MAIYTIHVLLCDDHAVVRAGFRHLLESTPDIVVQDEAGTGEEAYQLYRIRRADVIIMDIDMPGMGGFAAARHILEYNSNANIMLLSMHGSKTLVARAIKSGVKGYLTKRVAPDKLIKAVRLLSSGCSYIEPSLEQKIGKPYIAEEGPINIFSLREFEVFIALADGLSVQEISSMLHLSPKTVEMCRTNIMKKIDAHNLEDTTKLAVRHGLITA